MVVRLAPTVELMVKPLRMMPCTEDTRRMRFGDADVAVIVQ